VNDYPLDMTLPEHRSLMRASDADRAKACEALGEHFSVGRLDMNDYDDRAGSASSAQTIGELHRLFDDLPLPHPASCHAHTDDVAGREPALPVGGGGLRQGVGPAYGMTVAVPHGLQPSTGRPYSDKQKVPAGVLQILLGSFGAGRCYTGHTRIAIAQLLLTVLSFGMLSPLTVVWGLIDGILILTGDATDRHGRPLR